MEENKSIAAVADTIYLYSCATKGVAPEKDNIDYNAAWNLCKKLKIRQTVAYAVKLGGINSLSASVYGEAQSTYFSGAVKNQKRIEATLSTIKELENAGVEVTVLKGFDFARNYANPYCRSSADSDLLVDEKDEEKATSILKGIGYTVKPHSEESHHAECTHPEAGLIELHTRLWDNEIDILSFGNAQKEFIGSSKKRVDFCSEKISVLEETNSLIFGIFHSVKHFVVSCCGLKMLFDIALFAEHNEKFIDKKRLAETVDSLGYSSFVGAIFRVFGKYGNLNLGEYEKLFPCTDEQEHSLLVHIAESDMDEKMDVGGNNAQYSFYLTNKRKKMGLLFRIKKALSVIIRIAFPKPSSLLERFPYLKKHKYLYPVAVIQRAFERKKGIKRATMESLVIHDKEYTQSDLNRISTLKDFGLIQ